MKNPKQLFTFLTYTLVVLLFSQNLAAQTPDSVSVNGTDDFMGFESISILCNASPYIGTTADASPSVAPAGFCESVENDQFICFQTNNSTTAVFEFSLLSCTGSGSGIEVGVVGQNGSAIGGCIIVDDPASEERLEITGLEPLTEYCLRVDGIQGATCEFAFEAISGVGSDDPRQPNMPVLSAGPYCYGDTVGVSIERIPSASTYRWGLSSPNVIFGHHYLDADGVRLTGDTQDSIIQLVLPDFDITKAPGHCDTIYSFVTAINGCGASDESLQQAILLCTSAIDTLTFSTCGGDSTAVEYPAGSNIFYYDIGGQYQSAPAPNGSCDEVIAILVEEGVGGGAYFEIDTTVCEFPIVLEGDTIFTEGLYEFYFSVSTSECDSVVAYTVRSPSAQGAALDNPYCTNEFVRVGNSPWDNNFTYTWNDDQGALAGETPNDYLNQFDVPGIYTLTVSHLGCTYLIDVVVESAPEMSIIDDNDVLTATVAGGADSIALYINEVFEVGDATSIDYQGLLSLTDSVSFRICAFSNCGTTCETLVFNGVSASREAASLTELLVWPNPSSGIVNIKSTEVVDGTVHVYNSVGSLVHLQNIETNTLLDLTDHRAGVYSVLILENGSGRIIATNRILIQ